MLPLPAVPPQLGWHSQVRLGRDYYVRLDASDYSVDPAMIGHLVEVTAGLDRVQARAGGHVAADHARVRAAGSPSPTPPTLRRPGGCARSSVSPTARHWPVT
jgi:Mu transposase, C-terminal domain